MSEYQNAQECLRAHGFDAEAQILDETNAPTPYEAWAKDNAIPPHPNDDWSSAMIRQDRNARLYEEQVLRPRERALWGAIQNARYLRQAPEKPQDEPESMDDSGVE